MKIVKTRELSEGEILARDVINKSGVILIPEGTVLKNEYISKMLEIGYEVAYIKDDEDKQNYTSEIKEVYEECVEKVKKTMEVYFSSDNAELTKIKDIANKIIEVALTKKEVMLNIDGLRKNDEKKYSHSINVAGMSVVFAIKMGLSKKIIDEIATGALLHDIGYSVVQAKIDNNLSSDILADKEAEIRKHVLYGYSMIQNENWISDNSKNIVLYHHERIDGSGYPFHRMGDKIDIHSRIVAVCDEFDTLVYQNNMKVHKAIEKILSQGGVTLDLEVVKVFNEIVAAYPIGSKVVTSEGDIGIVLKQNNKCPTRPVIRIIRDKNGEFFNNKIEDLTENLTLFIQDTYE